MNFDVGQFHKDLHYEGAARAGYTVNTSDVLNLHYKSVLPNLLELVLGPKEYSPFSGFSQVPIRFPGDLCDGDERGFDPIYERQNWHIDSIARIEGIGHATEIKNFDTTIVILLSDTHGKNSGELATFPGSHLILSSLFRRDKQLIQQLKADGLAALPRHEKSDAILGTKPYHCLGKVGDMFILNYMNAHFPTCNLSPYIRYAAFFRFTGPAFPPDSVPHEERPESMFNPLIHWRI